MSGDVGHVGQLFIELGDLENIYLAFGISFVSVSVSEVQVLPVLEATILKFRLPVTLRSNKRSAVELPVLENTGLAV